MDSPDLQEAAPVQTLSREAYGQRVVDQLALLHAYVSRSLGQVVRQHDATSDVVQSAVRDLLIAYDRFQYRGEAAFRGFVLEVVYLKILEKRRFYTSRKNEAPLHADVPIEHLADGSHQGESHDGPVRTAIQQELKAKLQGCMERLEPLDRQIVILIDLLGMTSIEAAAHLSMPDSTVRHRHKEARIKLAAWMVRGRGLALDL